VERCRDPFSRWASLFVHTGEVGSGTRAKLARNLVTFASFVAAGEAQRLAEAAGIDLVRLGEIVRHSDKVTGGPGAIMFRDATGPLPPDDPWREVLIHTAELGRKDLSLALELAEDLGVEMPMGRLALDKLSEELGVA
jgi:3-hydroxyisobutyrate dehydrogenase-like beta-hydroxyacid dehydrogenase